MVRIAVKCGVKSIQTWAWAAEGLRTAKLSRLPTTSRRTWSLGCPGAPVRSWAFLSRRLAGLVRWWEFCGSDRMASWYCCN